MANGSKFRSRFLAFAHELMKSSPPPPSNSSLYCEIRRHNAQPKWIHQTSHRWPFAVGWRWKFAVVRGYCQWNQWNGNFDMKMSIFVARSLPLRPCWIDYRIPNQMPAARIIENHTQHCATENFINHNNNPAKHGIGKDTHEKVKCNRPADTQPIASPNRIRGAPYACAPRVAHMDQAITYIPSYDWPRTNSGHAHPFGRLWFCVKWMLLAFQVQQLHVVRDNRYCLLVVQWETRETRCAQHTPPTVQKLFASNKHRDGNIYFRPERQR